MLKTYALRLLPQQDLKKALIDLVKTKSIKAGVVLSSVGSLSELNIRLASSDQFLKLKQPFEILALNGTLCSAGVHLHISVADSAGQCFGGHLMDGNIILTTCELVILDSKNYEFDRQLDPKTGYKELLIK